MARHFSAIVCAGCLIGLSLAICSGYGPDALAGSKKTTGKRPITNPKFDPSWEEVELFAAIVAKQIETKMIPRDALGGTVFIENKTDKPLNVKVPEALIGVSVNAQFGGGGGLGGGGLGGQGGGQQALGGGLGGGGGGGLRGGGLGGGQAGGGGFFSIPPERIVALQFTSVCLQHGKPEPTSSSRYRLIPVSQVTKDPVLYELLATVGTGKIDPQAAQAAAWTISDNMSWEQLEEKYVEHLGGQPSTPYFTQEQLMRARQLLGQSVERSANRTDESRPTELPRAQRVSGGK